MLRLILGKNHPMNHHFKKHGNWTNILCKQMMSKYHKKKILKIDMQTFMKGLYDGYTVYIVLNCFRYHLPEFDINSNMLKLKIRHGYKDGWKGKK